MAASTHEDPSRPKKQQLRAGMEHARFAVTYTPSTHSNPTTPPTSSDKPLGEVETFLSTNEPIRTPASRSHDPTNNQKRTDPFRFGSRFLEDGDDVFEFNAWDHVEVDDAYREFSAEQFAKQREAPVSEFDRNRFNGDPVKFWNLFYKNNKVNFFKNRKWLFQEFPVLAQVTSEDAPPATVLEVGAGAGNTAFPVVALNKNPHFKLHACDFSSQAVQLIRSHPEFQPEIMQADVWDLAASSEDGGVALPPNVEAGSIDVVVLVFTFSALAPTQWANAVRNVRAILKPGGQVLFRDYGHGDLAQVRFKKGRYLEENFYVRGDGTRVYFFAEDELARIWAGKSGVEKAAREREELKRKKLGESENDTNGALKGTVAAPSGQITEDDPSSTLADLSIEDGDKAIDGSEPFIVENFGVDRRMLVNRQRKLKMYRCWLQARFRKPSDAG